MYDQFFIFLLLLVPYIYFCFFFLMRRRPPRSTLPDTLFPYTTLFRSHPVAGFGQVAGAVEQRVYADSRARGVLFTVSLAGGTTVLGLAVERTLRDRPVLLATATASATWAVLGGTSLGREASAVYALLATGDLPGARQRLTHLVGRDTSQLTESEVARATIESVAENTSDAVTAPLVWGAVLGVPGLVGYRAANTPDAMVGHRNPRYARFGWASARWDDLLNLAGARPAARPPAPPPPSGRREEPRSGKGWAGTCET